MFNVVVNLFLFNRLVAWLGVRNTTLIQPIAYVIVFLGFLLGRQQCGRACSASSPTRGCW